MLSNINVPLYVDEIDLDTYIFPLVSSRYGRIEEVPNYKNEQGGMLQLLGVLERVRNDNYYPSLLEKATYLLVAINKGHFFSNGNKRLALVVTIYFLVFNTKDLKDESKEFYSKLIDKIFPEREDCEDFPDFSGSDYAMYHLSIIIAMSGALGISFDDLKKRVSLFLEESITVF